MKKLLVLAIMAMGFNSYSQSAQSIMDGVKQRDKERALLQKEKENKSAIFDHPNAEFIKSLQNMNEQQALELSNQIMEIAKTKWAFLTIKENDRGYRIFYYDLSFPKPNPENLCETCNSVKFDKFYEGANPALEIIGVKTLRFNNVSGKYLDLFPIWKKVFRPEADIVETSTNPKIQELRHMVKNILFKFEGIEDNWQITNWSR